MISEIVGWTIVSCLGASILFGMIIGYFNQKPTEKEADINKKTTLSQQSGTESQ